MGTTQFGSRVYTWLMLGAYQGYDNKLDHMIKIISEAGLAGSGPTVFAFSSCALGCSKYWLGPRIAPIPATHTLQKHNMKLLDLALVRAWSLEVGAPIENEAAGFTIHHLKHFPGAMLGTVPLPASGMDVIATVNKWRHLVNHIHYKDFSGNGAEPWAQMGTGKLDFHKITEWLVARNYEGWIICEAQARAPLPLAKHQGIAPFKPPPSLLP